MLVEWYRNPHEHCNNWLRFGFMRLHQRGELVLKQLPLRKCVEAGFSQDTANHNHRHTSVIALREGKSVRRLIVDSEDSFFFLSPLIRDCDIYFCSGFSGRFFRESSFVVPYEWQTEDELSFYRKRARDLIDSYGGCFAKVVPFVPIGPNLSRRDRISFARQKARNLRHRAWKSFSDMLDWRGENFDFEVRYTELLSYRQASRLYDVVLVDSLWGWPRHRVALHAKLAELSDRFVIHSRLSYAQPVACDASDRKPLSPETFPMTRGHVGDYELMMARSRTGVFATGFHWGWRNIMTLSLMMGLPVVVDRLVVEPWFDMKEFTLSQNEKFGFSDLEKYLDGVPNDLSGIKTRNQAIFDKYLAPERVASYLLGVHAKWSGRAVPA